METEIASMYAIFNALVSRNFSKIELYAGGKKLTGFKAKNPIIDAGNPFEATFDAGRVGRAVVGTTAYCGFRYFIK